MAVDSALTKTTAATGGAAVKNRYYDELFLRVAENQLVHKQVGQVNRKIGKGEGGYGANTVYWTRWSNLPIMTAAGAEGVPTTAVGMTAANVTGTTNQYDAAISISDLLAYTSFGDVMKAAMERLAYNAGLSIDTIILNEVKSSGGFLSPASTVSAQAAYTGLSSTATVDITTIKKAVRKLERQDARPLSDGFYVASIHPDVNYIMRRLSAMVGQLLREFGETLEQTIPSRAAIAEGVETMYEAALNGVEDIVRTLWGHREAEGNYLLTL